MLGDFSDQIDLKVGPEDVGWQNNELLLGAGAPNDLEDGRLVMEVALGEANFELRLHRWIVKANTLDIVWIEDGKSEGVDLSDTAEVYSGAAISCGC